jgi:hypothetical protein
MELDSDLELKRRFDAIVNGLKPAPTPFLKQFAKT